MNKKTNAKQLALVLLAAATAIAADAATPVVGVDSDGDGLTDEIELSLKKKDGVQFSPLAFDSDGDGYSDAVEALQADPHSITVVTDGDDLRKAVKDKKAPYAFLEVSALWCQPSWLFAPVYLNSARAGAGDGSIAFLVHPASDDPLLPATPFTHELGVTAFPTTLLVGPGGAVLGRMVGYDPSADFAARFQRLAANLAAATHDGYLSFPEALEARRDFGFELRLDRDAFLSLAPATGDDDNDGLLNEAELGTGTDPFDADSDNDGVADGRELSLGLNPLDGDHDDDAFSDGEEIDLLGSNPFDPNDPVLVDSDQDGAPDPVEIVNGTDPHNADTDGDGFSDGTEFDGGSDPLDPASTPNPTYDQYLALAMTDSDDDGWSDLVESAAGETPVSVDVNGDGLRDLPAEIVALHIYMAELDPTSWPFVVEPGAIVTDADADGLPDDQEDRVTADDLDQDGVNDLDDELLRFIGRL